MPKSTPTPRLRYKTYRHLLRALTANTMILFRRIPTELSAKGRESPPLMDFSTVARNFLIISGLLRRSIVVARYIETLPVPTEEREHRLGAALERVFARFATRKMTVEEYNWAVEAELDGDPDLEVVESVEDDLLDADFDDVDTEYDPDADVPGRSPASLVAELCRDFGMIAHAMPAEWLTPVPVELRLLCARAAAASIRPSGPSRRPRPQRSLEG